jgi:sulfur carrier protein
VKFNGREIEPFEGSVEAFVASHVGRSTGIAVAVDGEIVPRSKWSQISLIDALEIDIVTAAAGG